jgi:immunity protein Imm1 of predicted polymorphic toxin system
MIVSLHDCQDQTSSVNGLAVTSDDQLLQVLDSLRTRQPFFVELIGENGYELLVGIGGSFGCAQYGRSDGEPPYLVAVSSARITPRDHIEFLAGNTPTPISSRYILSFQKVKEIASYFRATGTRSTDVSWEQI